MTELPSIAVFHYDDLQPFIFVDIKTFDHVFTITDHHELGLSFAEPSFDLFNFLIRFSFDSNEVKYFDGYCFFGDIIHAFVDSSESTSA